MSRSWFGFVFAAIATACAACSPTVVDGSSTAGSGGGGGTSSTTATTGSVTSGSSTVAPSSTSSSTGAGGGSAGSCDDPSNPMFGSCVVPFLAGCWAPDLSGTCTDENGVTAWSDGSKFVTQGSMPGLYGPGEAAPCIAMVLGQDSITATRGSETLQFLTASGSSVATITCPDGTTFTATNAQVTAFNVCSGLNCP